MGAFWEWLRRKGIVRRMAAYKRSDVVRMFPDDAGTVLWYGGGPVDYEDAHLPGGAWRAARSKVPVGVNSVQERSPDFKAMTSPWSLKAPM
jgi:hypothetical protein